MLEFTLLIIKSVPFFSEKQKDNIKNIKSHYFQNVKIS